MGETNREAREFSVVRDHRAMTQPEETGFGGQLATLGARGVGTHSWS